jgi:flagellar assembly protein FliH
MNLSIEGHPMTSTVRKFTFDTEFSHSGEVFRVEAARRASFTPGEVEHERQIAYAQGQADAMVKAEEALAHAAQTLARQAQLIVGHLSRDSATLRQEATMLALAAARKIAGTAIDQFGEETIAAAVEDALSHLRHGPRVAVRVAPDIAEKMTPRLEDAARSVGFEGGLAVRADASVAPGDVSIEWAGGAVILEHAETAARVEEAIMRRLAQTGDEPTNSDILGGG